MRYMKLHSFLFTILTCGFIFQIHPSQIYQYDLAVCAIFQNEARFMKEWIEFYRLIGVQHFYLYNNRSTDNYLEVLSPYIEKGEVELFDWNYSNEYLYAQDKAYDDALKRSTGIVKWLAIIDLDEFLFPVQDKSLANFLKDYEEFGGVCANWVMFGTSDVNQVPQNELMIKYLIKCDSKGNKHIKSIIRPDRVDKILYAHIAQYKPGFFQVNADKIRFNGPFSPYIAIDKIRINHYWTRDIYWLFNVKLPRVEALKANTFFSDDQAWYLSVQQARAMTPREWCLTISKFMNVQEDKTIYKYLQKLEETIYTK